MATLEITVSNRKTGQIKAHQIFEMDDDMARLFLEQMETMLDGFEKPVQVVKTMTPGGVTTIDIMTPPYPAPPVVSPSFEKRYRRALPPPQEEENL